SSPFAAEAQSGRLNQKQQTQPERAGTNSAQSASGQSPSAQSSGQSSRSSTPAQSTDDAIQLKSTLVSVPVIVSDRSGRDISDLRREASKLNEDRAKQRTGVFDTEEEAITVALLLATSRSTAGVLDDIKDSATKFLKEMRPRDRAMVVSFDGDIHVLCGLTSDKRSLEQAVKSARIGDRVGTELRDAVAQVFDRHFRNVEGRKAI